MRAYLDSCIVIYLVQGSSTVRSSIQNTLRKENPSIFVSPLTRLECRVWPLRQEAPELLAAFDRFFLSRDLRRSRMTHAVFDRATELRAGFGVRTPDALHIAAAIESACDEFWTNDRRIPRDIETWIRIRVVP